MAIRKKDRRKICIYDKEYIWYIKEDYDSPYYVLNIASDDKQLILSCPIDTEISYLISKGKIFQNKATNGKWNRYLLPFKIPKTITPSFVSKVIDWAIQDVITETIECNGKSIPV